METQKFWSSGKEDWKIETSKQKGTDENSNSKNTGITRPSGVGTNRFVEKCKHIKQNKKASLFKTK